MGRATELVFVLATGMMLTIGGTAQAQATLEWDVGNFTDPATDPAVGGDGIWGVGGPAIWNDGTSNVSFVTGDNAIFGAPIGYFVSVGAGGVTANDITLNANDIEIAGGPLTVTGQVNTGPGVNSFINSRVAGDIVLNVDGGILNLSGTVSGTVQTIGSGQVDIVNIVGALDSDDGLTTINGAGTNNGTVTGATTIDDSTVRIDSGALSIASTVTVDTGGTLEVNGGTVGDVTVNGTGVLDANRGIIGDVILNDNAAAYLGNATGGPTIASFTQTTTLPGQSRDKPFLEAARLPA